MFLAFIVHGSFVHFRKASSGLLLKFDAGWQENQLGFTMFYFLHWMYSHIPVISRIFIWFFCWTVQSNTGCEVGKLYFHVQRCNFVPIQSCTNDCCNCWLIFMHHLTALQVPPMGLFYPSLLALEEYTPLPRQWYPPSVFFAPASPISWLDIQVSCV